MAKAKKTNEEDSIDTVEIVTEKTACANPTCGHMTSTNRCEYCGYEN
jgi:hypothetical protein